MPEQVGIHNGKRGSEFVCDVIKRFNVKVLGCSTLINYKNKVKVYNYLEWCINQYNFLEENKKLYINLGSTYYSNNISCQKICTTFKIPSVLAIADNTGVHRKTINEYFNFKPDANELNNLLLQVNYYLLNPLEFSFERVNGRIFATPLQIKEAEADPCISLKKAFDYPLDLTKSVLSIDDDERLFSKSDEFITSWIYFNNPNLTEIERMEYKINPLSYFKIESFSNSEPLKNTA